MKGLKWSISRIATANPLAPLEQRAPESILEQLTARTDSAAESLERREELALLKKALRRIDARSRLLLSLLFDCEDGKPSYRVISEKMGIPVGSIGPTRARCLQKLRSEYDLVAAVYLRAAA